jgi:hypothetical protein
LLKPGAVPCLAVAFRRFTYGELGQVCKYPGSYVLDLTPGKLEPRSTCPRAAGAARRTLPERSGLEYPGLPGLFRFVVPCAILRSNSAMNCSR